MAVYDEASIQDMIDEFGVDITIGAVTAKGIVDRADEEMVRAGFGRMIGLAILVTVKTTAFASYTEGDTITVEGEVLKIGRAMKIGDGALTRVLAVLN